MNGNGQYSQVLSYLHNPGKTPLLDLTVGKLIDKAALQYGHSEAVVFCETNTRRTFAELKDEIDELAAGFLKIGLKQGDRVGCLGPNCFYYYLTVMATWKAGLILVTINPASQPQELLYCLQNVGAKCLVVAEDYNTYHFYDIVTEILPEILTSELGKIKSTAAPELRILITMESTALAGTFTIEQIRARGKNEFAILARAEALIQFDDICGIMFTSGTTGNPKGVKLSHHNIVNNGYIMGRGFSYTENDKLCVPVAMSHIFGSMAALVGLIFGATCVFPSRTFQGEVSMDCIAAEKCTVLYGTPTMHMAMLEVLISKIYDMSFLRLAITAAGICPAEIVLKMKQAYTVEEVVALYGMTESGSIFQHLPGDSDTLRSSTVGYPMEHSEVKVVDQNGRIVPRGVPGEICVRAYSVTEGYWDDQVKTAELLKPTKWLHSGDLAIMTKGGHAIIVGRIKDTIIVGGENVFPKEIEEILHKHQKILECHAFGVPDARLGEEVAVWIQLKKGEVMSQNEVKKCCFGKLAFYKIPSYVLFVKDFPRTTSGKVQKMVMRTHELTRQFVENERSKRMNVQNYF